MTFAKETEHGHFCTVVLLFRTNLVLQAIYFFAHLTEPIQCCI